MEGVAPTYADVDLALDGGFVEWRVVPVVPGVWVGSLTQQQRHHLKTKAHDGFLSLQKRTRIKLNIVLHPPFSAPPPEPPPTTL